LPAGAQVTYAATTPDLVSAVHAWFDAQLMDHGAHAMGPLSAPEMAVRSMLRRSR
jgi:hypothetical protein